MLLNCISSWAFGQWMYLHTILHDVSLTLQIDSALNIDIYRYMQRRYQTVRIFSQWINIEVVHRWTDLINTINYNVHLRRSLQQQDIRTWEMIKISAVCSYPLPSTFQALALSKQASHCSELINKRLFLTTCSLYRHCNKQKRRYLLLVLNHWLISLASLNLITVKQKLHWHYGGHTCSPENRSANRNSLTDCRDFQLKHTF